MQWEVKQNMMLLDDSTDVAGLQPLARTTEDDQTADTTQNDTEAP